MDPGAVTFHRDDGVEPLPLEWPRFVLGEEVEVKGITFVVQRINRSNLVLRPVPASDLLTVRGLMRKLTV